MVTIVYLAQMYAQIKWWCLSHICAHLVRLNGANPLSEHEWLVMTGVPRLCAAVPYPHRWQASHDYVLQCLTLTDDRRPTSMCCSALPSHMTGVPRLCAAVPYPHIWQASHDYVLQCLTLTDDRRPTIMCCSALPSHMTGVPRLCAAVPYPRRCRETHPDYKYGWEAKICSGRIRSMIGNVRKLWLAIC